MIKKAVDFYQNRQKGAAEGIFGAMGI
jgi:nitrate/nitrite transporter NarK